MSGPSDDLTQQLVECLTAVVLNTLNGPEARVQAVTIARDVAHRRDLVVPTSAVNDLAQQWEDAEGGRVLGVERDGRDCAAELRALAGGDQ